MRFIELSLVTAAVLLASVAEGRAAYESNKPDLKAGVESGGWVVAWADDIAEKDVAAGLVAGGVSIYAGNPAPFYAWVEQLVDRTVSSLGDSARQRFPAAIRDQAKKAAADAIRAAIRGKSAQEVVRHYDTVDFKAGAIKYSGRNYNNVWNIFKHKHEKVYTTPPTWGIKPYVAFRWRGSGGGGDGGSSPSTARIDYTIRNDAGRDVTFRLPSGRTYTLKPGQRGKYDNTGTPGTMKIHVLNSGKSYTLTSGDHKLWWMAKENRVALDLNYNRPKVARPNIPKIRRPF